MTLLKFYVPKEFHIDGSLVLKRNIFLKYFLFLLNAFMLPLGLYWLLSEYKLLGISLLLFLSAFNTNVILSLFNRPFLIAYPIVMLTLSLTLFMAVYYIGFSAALWTYPIIIAIFFIIPIRAAALSNLLIIIPIISIVVLQQDTTLAARYCASTAATFALGIYLVKTIVALQQQLLTQSTTDPLTGAYNRRHMDSTLHRLVQRPEFYGHQHVILMLDLDFFKKINDTHGHEVGDIALQDMVNIVLKNIRKKDEVFRIGGEEFIVLLKDIDSNDALAIGESLRQVIATVPIKNSQEMLSVSIGLSRFKAGMSHSQWLNDADSLLYEAKRTGRNRVISNIVAA